ncbi:hypothetical protein N8H41_25530, partial [Pseudomonas vlassakiae]|uniref:hypothetical protein n=1 Tax=Pseudomonas vlassakiae TaxID=485888 RepID=UPI0021C7780F
TGPKQMWERACPRCAARAALDLTGAEHPKAGTKADPVGGTGVTGPKQMWEILWFSASQFPAFGDVFVLIFHQG